MYTKDGNGSRRHNFVSGEKNKFELKVVEFIRRDKEIKLDGDGK
jgi:hypothetical protein